MRLGLPRVSLTNVDKRLCCRPGKALLHVVRSAMSPFSGWLPCGLELLIVGFLQGTKELLQVQFAKSIHIRCNDSLFRDLRGFCSRLDYSRFAWWVGCARICLCLCVCVHVCVCVCCTCFESMHTSCCGPLEIELKFGLR